MSRSEDDLREEVAVVVGAERLRNSLSGNPRWDLLLKGGGRRRTDSDSMAGHDMCGIAASWRIGDGNRRDAPEPTRLVLMLEPFGMVRGVREEVQG